MTVPSDLQTPAPPSSLGLGKGAATPHLAAVERSAIVVSAALVLTTLLWGGPRVQLGACVGSVLSLLNARSLRFFGSRLSGSRFAAGGSAGLLVILFQLKLGVLAALIYLALKLLPIHPVALMLGLSVLPLAIVVHGIRYGLQAAAPESAAPYSDSYRET